MNELEKQVRRAYRRLGFQRFLNVLAWSCSATLLVALLLIGVDRFHRLGVPAWCWAAGALGLGLAAAAVWMLATRRGRLGAAIEIDRRFALKERVSSTLAMDPEERQTEAGQALIADAARRVGRIDVASRFAVAPGRAVLLPLLLAALTAAVALIPPMAGSTAEAKPNPTDSAQNVVKAAKTLREKLAERRKEAQQQQLKDAEGLFKKLEQGTRDLAEGKMERKDALATLNDLNRELQQRRNELGSDQIKSQLDQLKDINQGPADKLSRAIRQGDFKKALEELEALKGQLAGGNLGEEQKQELAKQLEQIEEKLKNLAEAQQAQQKRLQEQIDQLRQDGNLADANKLQEQLDKLLQQAPQMNQLNDLANKLGQCAKCLGDGKLDDAIGALEQLQADLKQQLDELKMLDEAMEQLRQARDQMNCPNCNGAGCELCQGPPGMGLGEGQGKGPRPEAKDDTDSYDSQVRQKPGEGAAVVTDLVDGPNVRGNVEEEIRHDFDAASRGDTDPLTGRNIPRAYQKHVTEYFDRFREGQ